MFETKKKRKKTKNMFYKTGGHIYMIYSIYEAYR